MQAFTKHARRWLLAKIGGHATRLSLSPRQKRVDGLLMQLDLEQQVDAHLFYRGVLEPETRGIFQKRLTPGMTAVDVGANIGYMTLLMARQVGPTGHVIAFEASPWAFERLKHNIHLNGFNLVDLINAAVGDGAETSVTAHFPCGYRLDGTNTALEQTIKAVCLDDVLDGRKVDFIKIDTDGWEPAILEGARETLRASRPVLYLEYGPDHCRSKGFDPVKMIEMLEDTGYTLLLPDGQPFSPDLSLGRMETINILAVNHSRDSRSE